jgi:DNA-binding transcriptional ArsR family regulator
MDGLSRTYEALLAGAYDCLDRIVVNAYFRMGHDAGGFRVWWRKLAGSEETLDNAHLMRMAGRFSRRLRAWAAEHSIPVRDCRVGDAKHEIGEEFLRQTTIPEGLFLVLVSRAPAPVWDVHPNRRITRKKPAVYVNHYSFHILDSDWGHITIKIRGHPPFPAQVILNGHEYMDRQARKAGILFIKEGNCFSQISDLTGFARIAETLTDESVTGRIAAVCRRWIYSTCVNCAVDADERQRTGFRYEYSVYQFEYNRDLIFHQGCEMSAVLEALVDRNRVRMDVPLLKTILGQKNRPYVTKNKRLTGWQVTVERPSYDFTIFKVHCGKLALKIYSKGERVLRTEAMARNVDALKCGRSLERLPRMVQVLKSILERFLESLSCMDRCFVSGIQLESLPEPSVVGQAKIAGIDFNRTRTLQVARAVLALSVRPKGFTASQLAEHVRRQTNTSPKDYGPRQAAYDLKKFRGRELVRLVGKSRRYEPTQNGLTMISGLIVLREECWNRSSAAPLTGSPTHPLPIRHL